MGFGKNLLLLRKIHSGMTQEELAEKLSVSRQTISKWELEAATPEMDKLIELCELFSCSLDELVRTDMGFCADSYSNIRTERVAAFRYIRYAVISAQPEDDAISHLKCLAEQCGVANPQIIGWDFPFVSQEQINVFHMRGYTAALILPQEADLAVDKSLIMEQINASYAAITVKEPFNSPFQLIPNAYKTLHAHIQMEGLTLRERGEVIDCFEKTYTLDGVTYMDVYIAVR